MKHVVAGGKPAKEVARWADPFSVLQRSIDSLFEGARTIAPGILGVTASGLAAAEQVVGCKPGYLLSATGQHLRIYPAEHPETWPVELQPKKRAA